MIRKACPSVGVALAAILALAGGQPAAAAPHAQPPHHRPADFGFRIQNGWGECVDSDSGTVTKDMVRGPDTTVALRFTPAELDTIYDAFVALAVFDLREPHPELNRPPGIMMTMSVATDHRFEIRGRGLTKHFSWTDLEVAESRRSTEFERLWRATIVVSHMVSRRPEFARLPQPRALRY